MAAAIPVEDVSFLQLSEEGKLEDFIIGQLLSDLERSGPHKGEFGARFSDPEEETGWQSEGQDIYAKPRYYFTAWPVEALVRMNDDNVERMESLCIVRDALTRRLGRGFIKIKVNWAPPGEKGTTVLDNYRHTIKGADLLLTMREGQPTVQNIVCRIMDHRASMQNSDGGWAQWSDMLTDSDLWASSYAARFLHRYIQSGWLHELMGEVTAHQRNLENRLDVTLRWLEDQWRADKWTYGKKLPWVSSAPLVYAEIVSCLKERSDPFLLEPVHAFMELLDASGYVRPTKSGLAASQEISDYRLGIWICFCLGNVADENPEARAYCERLWMHLMDRGRIGMDLRTYEWVYLLQLSWQMREKHHPTIQAENDGLHSELTMPMRFYQDQDRCNRIVQTYAKSYPGLIDARDLDSVNKWLVGWLSQIYPRIRLYWYDQNEETYYGLFSYGMNDTFRKVFDADLIQSLPRTYPIPYIDVVYKRSPNCPRVKHLDKEDLQAAYSEMDVAPPYFRDIFRTVDQTLTIEITEDSEIFGAVSLDFGEFGNPFSGDAECKEELLLGALINAEWGASFKRAIRLKMAQLERASTGEVNTTTPVSPQPTKVNSSFLMAHKMGKAFAVRHIKPPNNVMVFNAAVSMDQHPLNNVFSYLNDFAQQETVVRNHFLLMSETRCGKEILAAAIHEYGYTGSRNGPFVKQDIATVNKEFYQPVMEGSITKGENVEMGEGKFGEAEGGCLFLDNVHYVAPEIQTRMLRNLQGHRTPLYGQEVKTNCRVIIALNGNIDDLEIPDFRFRLDELCRCISLPPLADRRCDIVVLAAYHLDAIVKSFTEDRIKEVMITGKTLRSLYWDPLPGNFATLKGKLSRIMETAYSQRRESVIIEQIPGMVEATPETNKWTEWISNVDDGDLVPLYPWWQADGEIMTYPVDEDISREDRNRQTALEMWDRIVIGKESFANVVPIPKGTPEENRRSWDELLALMQIANENGCRNRNDAYWHFSKTLDDRIKHFSKALKMSDAMSQVDAVLSQGSDAK